jgi:2-oxoglutarate/2-oxoacid ferredoxin oxidoreductase subunit beta
MEMGEIICDQNIVYQKTELLTDVPLSYCPGCGHGTAHRILLEVIDEMGIAEDTIGIASVGCSVFSYEFMDLDFVQVPHGRATAAATGVKRVCPDKFVFTYQGDGDLAAIGTSETIHSCNRGENITIIFINNGIYGMTGGQMAPTTIPGMKSSTTPTGRETALMGNNIDMSLLVAQLAGTYYVTRQSVHKPANVRKAKMAIRKAFELQKEKKGTTLVEIVSNCNTNWRMSPIEANKWLEENLLKHYPLGDIKVDGKLVKNKV